MINENSSEHPFNYDIKPAPGQEENVKQVTTDSLADYKDAIKFDPNMLDPQASRVTIPDVQRYSEQGFDLFLLDHLAKLFNNSSVLGKDSYRLEDIILDSKQYHALCDYLRHLSGLVSVPENEAGSLLEVVESGRLLPAEAVKKIAVVLQNKDEYLKS